MSLLLLAEMFFFFKVMQVGNGDVSGVIFKSVLIVALFFFAYRGMNWIRWIVIVLLSLLALACLLAGYANSDWSFVIITICYGICAAQAYRMKPAVTSLTSEEAVAAEKNEPLPPGTFIAQGIEYTYPTLLRRFAAVALDAWLGWFLMIITMVILDDHESRSTIMITLAATLLLGYDPLLTTYSATLGQRLMKIRVRAYHDPSQRIPLWRAYARIVVKFFLGTISFFTIHSNVEHRAIHDFAGESVVINV
ncbi:RDD family protein [Chryseolinea serpens]|uniref:RDD family protein n=1 Tax=Chryseolinea serpens TaxID=947013 RepID=UPI001C88267C|nr:RDD family protein [Chryseolinea serpens]